MSEGRVPRESGHRTPGWDEPEAEQREVAANTTVASPEEETSITPVSEVTPNENTHEATESDSPLLKRKTRVMDTGAEISVVNDESMLENVCKGNKMALRTINRESVVDTSYLRVKMRQFRRLRA